MLWATVKGYDGLYKVSENGDIMSTNFNHSGKSKVIGGFVNSSGYRIVALYRNGNRKYFRVHRIVAEAFLPNPYNKPQVNHIDGDKSNNMVDNLEWVNNSENQIHSLHVLGNCHHKTTIPIKVIDKNTGKRYRSISEAARALGVSRFTISRSNNFKKEDS